MDFKAIIGILTPLIGTVAGSAFVFFMKKEMSKPVRRALTGFAAGVMIAASFWSLLIPAMEQSASMGKLSFIPCAVGFAVGIGFLLFLDTVVPHLHMAAKNTEGPKKRISKSAMMLLAVTIHNIPEGMAAGVVIAGMMTGSANITFGAALALAVGIAVQNIPEGAIISMPLRAEGMSKLKAFVLGSLSGAVEPVFALITIFAASMVVPAMPYLQAFAAGAMIYVVVEELIPEMSEGEHSNIGVVSFSVGFILMMILDVALG